MKSGKNTHDASSHLHCTTGTQKTKQKKEMMRRTEPRRALPLIKLFLLATRQVTKPFAKLVISYAAEHRAVDRACIKVGRFLLGSTGVLKQEADKQREKAAEAAKAKQREIDLIAHVRIEVEDRLKAEVDELRSQLIALQEAYHNNRLPKADGEREEEGQKGSSEASAPPPTASASCVSEAVPLSCGVGATRPTLPAHKEIFGTDNSPSRVFPPLPRIETEPFTIPVKVIDVPLGDLSEAVKRGGVGGVAAPSAADMASSSSSSSETASAPLPTIDHGQPTQYQTHDGSTQRVVDTSSSSTSPASASDASAEFRISAVPVVDAATVATKTEGMAVSGGAAAVTPKPSASETTSPSSAGKDTAASSKASTSNASASPASSSPNSKKPHQTKQRFSFRKSINDAVNDRYYQPVADDTLRKAGAEMFVELFAFTVLSMILTYEYVSSKKSEAKREQAQLERLTALEKKVNEIAAKNEVLSLQVGSSELVRHTSLFGRMLGRGGGPRGHTDHESQTDADGKASADDEAEDDRDLDMHQRMMQRGLTP